jgi:hypothetical protein
LGKKRIRYCWWYCRLYTLSYLHCCFYNLYSCSYCSLGKTIPSKVPPAVIASGLPASSVVSYMTAIAGGGTEKLLAGVEGLTPEILAIGARAYEFAYSNAYRTIFLTSIAFGLLGIICNFFVPIVEDFMTVNVAATLGTRKGELMVEEKGIQNEDC